MKKRIISIVLCFVLVIAFSSCDDETSLIKTERIIAAEYGSANEIACEKYISDGFKKVTYNSSADVVLAVENKKADFGVLNESANGWTRELNLISWNGGKPKYDIRDWAPEHAKMGKGISLTKEELEALYDIIGEVLGK